MAIYSDDFQSYSVGQVPPLGSLTLIGLPGVQVVTTPAGILGKSKCVQINSFSALLYDSGVAYFSAVSIFAGWYFDSWNVTQFQILSDTHLLAQVLIHDDSTLEIISGDAVPQRVMVALDHPLNLGRWFWFQINLSFADVGGFVGITAEVAVGELSIGSGTLVTGISSASLAMVGANKFQFAGPMYLAELTIDTLQPIATDPNPGSPKARVTQGLAEVLRLPDSAQVLVTQGITEVLELPDSAALRVTQGLIELYITGILFRTYEA